MTLNSVSPLKKKYRSVKNKIIIKQLCEKNKKKGGLLEKNVQIFSPLYFFNNNYSINFLNLNNISSHLISNKQDNNKLKKESFYQYLFIHEFSLKKKSSEKNSIKFSNLTLDSSLNFKNKKISFILENLELISLNLFNSDSNNLYLRKDNYLNKKRINPFFLEDKMFINYKKSFLCYWLLPFLGLFGSAAPVLLKSTNSSFNTQIFENYDKNYFSEIESSFNNYSNIKKKNN